MNFRDTHLQDKSLIVLIQTHTYTYTNEYKYTRVCEQVFGIFAIMGVCSYMLLGK